MAANAHELYLARDKHVISIPNNYVKHAPVYQEWRDVQPINTPAFSGTVNFQLPKNGHSIAKVILKIPITGLDGNGTSATEKLSNGAGYNLIDEVRVQYNGQTIQVLNGTFMLLNHYLTYNHERQLANEKLVGIDTDAARATAFATGAATFWVELPLCFCKNKDVAVPVQLLDGNLSVDVRFKSAKTCMQFGTAGDGTYTATLGTTILRVLYLNTEKALMESLARQSLTTGLRYKIKDVQMMPEQAIASGQIQYDIKLSNFKGVIDSLVFVVRTASEVNGGAVANDLDNYKPISTFWIEGDGQRLTGTGIELEDEFVRYEMMPLMFSANNVPTNHSGVAAAPKYIYAYAFSLQPERIDSLGGFNVSAVNNPTLSFKFGTSLAANSLVDIYAFTNNFLEIKGGAIRKLFV